MRSHWRDGDRVRTVEVQAKGNARYSVTVDGVELELEVRRIGPDRMRLVTPGGASVAEITASGPRRFVRLGTLDFVFERDAEGSRRHGTTAHGNALEAPMPGTVTRVMVAAGDSVKKGQPLVALEAMKMEHVIRAPKDGRVVSVAARSGELVNGGVALVEME